MYVYVCIYLYMGVTLAVSGIAPPKRAIAILVSVPALALSTHTYMHYREKEKGMR